MGEKTKECIKYWGIDGHNHRIIGLEEVLSFDKKEYIWDFQIIVDIFKSLNNNVSDFDNFRLVIWFDN